MWVLSLLLGLLVVLLITAATGFFVAQEFSYAVDRSRLKARAATGDPARRALCAPRPDPGLPGAGRATRDDRPPRVDAVRPEETLDALWQRMSVGHSRYPLLDEGDPVVGVVHLQDVLPAPELDDIPVTSLARDPASGLTSMSLPDDALGPLTDTRNQMACVLDEYGGFAGVLTI